MAGEESSCALTISLSGLDNVVADGVANQLAHGVAVELFHDIGPMRFHGFDAKRQLDRHILAGIADLMEWTHPGLYPSR